MPQDHNCKQYIDVPFIKYFQDLLQVVNSQLVCLLQIFLNMCIKRLQEMIK